VIHTTEHLISVLAFIAVIVSVAGAVVFFDAITDINLPGQSYSFQSSAADAASAGESTEGANIALFIESEVV